MSRLARHFVVHAVHAVANVHARALLAGLLLGALVHALAAQRPDSAFALAMALVMVGAGAAAFVLHALAVSADGGGLTRVRGWIVALGLGVAGAVHGLASLGA